jgi:hypothetical protein
VLACSGHWFAKNTAFVRRFLTRTLELTPPKRKHFTYWHDQVLAALGIKPLESVLVD